MKNKNSSTSLLAAFVQDIKLAYGTGKADQIDEDLLDWPDLADTYNKAVDYLSRRNK